MYQTFIYSPQENKHCITFTCSQYDLNLHNMREALLFFRYNGLFKFIIPKDSEYFFYINDILLMC